MADPKNPFDFGTGSIDKDQWLRDIDAEQGDFVSRYSSAVNKHRAALMREAFADLRKRIANGDMLNRTADGQYQFGSALSREDKHMQEAYQRALGFMGDLARRQIQAPPATEPEKKALGSLEERYIKSLNPSGKFNIEAYWKNQTDEERRIALKDFLNKELKEAENYQDFGNFGDKDTYTQRLQTVMNLLESGKANDWSLQQLGFTKSWLTQPTNQEETETPKSKLEQANERLQAATEAQQVQQINQQVAALTAPSPTYQTLLTFNPSDYWNYDSFTRDRNKRIEALKYTDENGNEFLKANSILRSTPTGNGHFTNQVTTRNTAWNGQAAKDARTYAQSQYAQEISSRLNNYFKNLGVNYQSILNNDRRGLMTSLAQLFTQGPDNNYIMNDVINNLFVRQQDGKFGLRGSTLSYDPSTHTLYNGSNIDAYKEGGILKGQNGLIVDDSYYVTPSKPSKEQKTEATPDESKQQFSTAENARIAATIADIASIGAAFVPGYGTATSAVLGLGSTATNFGVDLADGQGLWGATKNAGFGLAADVMGLIPGLGGVGKGAKIARNLMWAVPKMMQWVNTYQGLQNAGEIKNSIMKLTSPSSMTVQDWQNVSQALQIMTGHGRSVATKVKKAGMSKTTTTTEPEHYIFTNKGKQKVSNETFKKLREARGTKARQALTQELVGEGITLQQTRFAPWNTSTRFGAFKEVPGKTKVEVQNKHKGWFSDENLVEKAENLNPSVDIRSILSKINPYRTYYNNRVPKSSPLPEYLKRPVDILPQGFGMTKSGMAAGGFNMDKPKRKPLTEEQKTTRRQKAAAKKQEQKAKELENLRRQQMYGMSEEIPQASSQTINTQRKQERVNLNSRFANEVEMPGPQIETQKNKFYRRYGNAIRGHQIGGILKALRIGGIIKAKWGDNTSDWMTPQYNPESSKQEAIYTNPYFPNIKYNGTAPWYKSRFSGESVVNLGNDDSGRADLPGGLTGNNLDYAFARNQAYVKSGQQNKQADIQGYFDQLPSPVDANNLQGLTDIYNKAIDELYLPFTSGKNVPDYLKTDATKHNLLFRQVYGSRAKVNGGDDNYDIGWNPDIIKTFGSASFARRPVNYETKWEDDLKNNLAQAKDRVSKISHNGIEGYVYTDENGRIHPLTNDQLKLINGQQAPQKQDNEKESPKVTDSERGDKTVFNTGYKNPNDPTPYIIAGKTTIGLLGNRNIYKNLLDEMPQAPLRDPIDRKLAIVGWQEAIKQGQNQLADLRNATWMQHGSNQQDNLAGMYETEGKGRDIMNDKFMKDSGRQFETAQKSWNLDNENTLYNIGVGDANRRSIADRARMMAQIRAAWRSGDNNIIMGALSDAGNWMMKNYQRESDLIDLVKQQQLGTREQFMENYVRNKHSDYDALKAKLADPNISDTEKTNIRTKIQQWHLDAIKEAPEQWGLKLYNSFHRPGFGGGPYTTMAKDGTKLEVAKLKARSKDNDRYVSMIKDLRTTRYRRRRR